MNQQELLDGLDLHNGLQHLERYRLPAVAGGRGRAGGAADVLADPEALKLREAITEAVAAQRRVRPLPG